MPDTSVCNKYNKLSFSTAIVNNENLPDDHRKKLKLVVSYLVFSKDYGCASSKSALLYTLVTFQNTFVCNTAKIC